MIQWRPEKKKIEAVLSYKLAMVLTENEERLLIGTEDNIRRRLEGENDAELIYDEVRPIGTLLFTMEEDENGDWSTAISKLYEAQEIIHSIKAPRIFSDKNAPAIEREAQDFLSEKFDTGDPICQYVALRIWYGYWEYREKRFPKDCMLYLNSMQNLIRPFLHYPNYVEEQIRVLPSNSVFRHTQELKFYDRERSIYRIKNVPNLECIIVSQSLIPLEKWYLFKFEKWKKYVIRCKRCNRLFLADNLKHKLCSDNCRHQSRISNLALRKENEDISKVDKICLNAGAHWYNRLAKIKASGEWSEYDIQEYEEAKNNFLAKRRKKRREYKMGKISFYELRDWLLKQEVEAQNTMDSLRMRRTREETLDESVCN